MNSGECWPIITLALHQPFRVLLYGFALLGFLVATWWAGRSFTARMFGGGAGRPGDGAQQQKGRV